MSENCTWIYVFGIRARRYVLSNTAVSQVVRAYVNVHNIKQKSNATSKIQEFGGVYKTSMDARGQAVTFLQYLHVK